MFSNCKTKVLNGSAIRNNFHQVGPLLAPPRALFCTRMRPSNISKRLTDSSRHGCLLKALSIRITIVFLKNSFHWPTWDTLLEGYDSGMSLITADLKELEERILLCLVHYFKAASPSSLSHPQVLEQNIMEAGAYEMFTWWQTESVWESGGQPTLKHPPPVTYFSHLLKFPQLPQPAWTAGN